MVGIQVGKCLNARLYARCLPCGHLNFHALAWLQVAIAQYCARHHRV